MTCVASSHAVVAPSAESTDTIGSSEPTVEVAESYQDYRPPADPAAVARFLLRYVPRKCQVGLKRVLLTNTSALSRHQQRQKAWAGKRQYQLAKVRGIYHPAHQGQAAWIEIFVDNVLQGWPAWFLIGVPMMKHMVFAETLYHEIGHHVHLTKYPEYAEREAVADKWARRLTAHFARRRYWYLLSIAFVMTMAFRVTRFFWGRNS